MSRAAAVAVAVAAVAVGSQQAGGREGPLMRRRWGQSAIDRAGAAAVMTAAAAAVVLDVAVSFQSVRWPFCVRFRFWNA